MTMLLYDVPSTLAISTTRTSSMTLLDRARALESLRCACERAIGEMDAGRRADARCTLVVELNGYLPSIPRPEGE